MSNDKEAYKKINNYLNLRDKFRVNEPGKMVHGRGLKSPTMFKSSNLKKRMLAVPIGNHSEFSFT